MKMALALGLFFLGCWSVTAPAALAQYQPYRPAPDKTPIVGQPQIVSTNSLRVNDKRIVFFGIDPMMNKQPCSVGRQTWDCGTAALRTLMNLVGREPVTCEPRVVDTFGRLFSKCTVHGDDIAMALVEAGMAIALPEETKDYVEAEQRAKAAKKGIWQGDFMTPGDFREMQTGHPQAR